MKIILYTIAILGLIVSFALMGWLVWLEITEPIAIYE